MDFRESLAAKADEKREHYNSLVATIHTLQLQLEVEKGYIENLNPLLVAEGMEAINLTPKGRDGGFATPGNRSDKMPPRREPFAQVSLRQAVDSILKSGNTLHANDLAEAIFDIRDQKDIRIVKHSLVGTLADGVKRGWWERVRPNTYQASTSKNGHRSEAENLMI